MITQIYRSKKKDGAYLYTKKGANLAELPESLLAQLGKLEPALVVVLTPEKKLAQADAQRVMESIEERGFYLQLPPPPEAYMQRIPNDKLSGQ